MAQSAFSGSLSTWGWVTIIIGVIQLAAGASLMGGGGFGRVIGIIAATIGAIESLLSVGGPHPLWSLGVFAISCGSCTAFSSSAGTRRWPRSRQATFAASSGDGRKRWCWADAGGREPKPRIAAG